ncbi:MAG: hypothetical protein QOE90_2438 [Thermoplasmata archaeon]|jgi:hypothetical protein|nr:hypothetical protein [Thermoplasmata archaeon]
MFLARVHARPFNDHPALDDSIVLSLVGSGPFPSDVLEVHVPQGAIVPSARGPVLRIEVAPTFPVPPDRDHVEGWTLALFRADGAGHPVPLGVAESVPATVRGAQAGLASIAQVTPDFAPAILEFPARHLSDGDPVSLDVGFLLRGEGGANAVLRWPSNVSFALGIRFVGNASAQPAASFFSFVSARADPPLGLSEFASSVLNVASAHRVEFDSHAGRWLEVSTQTSAASAGFGTPRTGLDPPPTATESIEGTALPDLTFLGIVQIGAASSDPVAQWHAWTRDGAADGDRSGGADAGTGAPASRVRVLTVVDGEVVAHLSFNGTGATSYRNLGMLALGLGNLPPAWSRGGAELLPAVGRVPTSDGAILLDGRSLVDWQPEGITEIILGVAPQ